MLCAEPEAQRGVDTYLVGVHLLVGQRLASLPRLVTDGFGWAETQPLV
jgi:hypothetical protein